MDHVSRLLVGRAVMNRNQVRSPSQPFVRVARIPARAGRSGRWRLLAHVNCRNPGGLEGVLSRKRTYTPNGWPLRVEVVLSADVRP
jgi:hypothetical protein